MPTTNENAAMAPSDSQADKPVAIEGPWRNLQRRTATAILLLAVALPVLWNGGWLLMAAMLVVAILMNREWEGMIPPSHHGWRALGLLYIITPILCILVLRDLAFLESAEASFYATLLPILLVIATDTAAYFCGRIIGGPKLAPRISPKKTWAGLLGGMAASATVAVLLLPYVPWPETTEMAILLGAMVALLAQAGDFFESYVKRRFDVKDSGTILPGHGGLLDRLDGYIFVLPAYLALVLHYADLLP